MIEIGWVAVLVFVGTVAMTMGSVIGILAYHLGHKTGANMVWKQSGGEGLLIGERAPEINDSPAEQTG